MKSLVFLFCLFCGGNLFAQSIINVGKKKITVKEILSINPETVYYTVLNTEKKIDTLKVETQKVNSIKIDNEEVDLNFINSYYREIDELGLFEQGMKDAKKRYRTNIGLKLLSFTSSYYVVMIPVVSDYVGAGIVLGKYSSHLPNEGRLMLSKEYPRSQYYMKGYEKQVTLRRRKTAWLSYHSGVVFKYGLLTSFLIFPFL